MGMEIHDAAELGFGSIELKTRNTHIGRTNGNHGFFELISRGFSMSIISVRFAIQFSSCAIVLVLYSGLEYSLTWTRNHEYRSSTVNPIKNR